MKHRNRQMDDESSGKSIGKNKHVATRGVVTKWLINTWLSHGEIRYYCNGLCTTR